ncbi:MAG: diguanylate cyclase [Deltaproteobacteria bacterium]|jgi:diguanylate cyclase (GGDEF)-like protein|nr:diguanylate cyclase [Deltaproteobacteria bacterium]MBW2511645.1 diguanylate cyclase [Deltaproteobacteria bacterium]
MSKPRILIVDDEMFFRHLFTEILSEGALYEIEAVDSGKKALDYLTRRQVDVILADMVMPEICGLELIRRTRHFNPAPDIILATGNATVETAIEALKGGARDYLLKPCNPEQLRHTVKSCVEQRRLLIENSHLHSQIRLYQRGQQLSVQLNVDTLFQGAMSTLLNELGSDRGLAFLASRESISHICTTGFADAQAEQLAGLLVEHTAVMTQATILKTTDCPEIKKEFADLDAMWIFPMNTENQEHGALVLCNPSNSEMPEKLPIENLSFLAEQIAIGFNNACQFRGARELIYTDDLTGLYNHRYLHIALEQEINRSERYGLEFSLAFIDLDLFKGINDVHGHLTGSDVLRQVGNLLRECVRDADMLFRYGGDEFTALLVETDTRSSKIVAERIRSRIESFDFSIGQDNTSRLTATVGHATYPIHATTKDEMIELADKAMYMGKHDRNVSRSASEVRDT